MAILIHRLQKLKGKKFFSYEMSIEKKFQLKKDPTTFALGRIDLNQERNILIVDQNTFFQKDLKECLNVLNYKNIHCIDKAGDLTSFVQAKKNIDNTSIFCFCDYSILQVFDWNFFNEKLKKNGIGFSIVAIHSKEGPQRLAKVYSEKIVATLARPFRLAPLRKILYKHLGPPLKKIAQ